MNKNLNHIDYKDSDSREHSDYSQTILRLLSDYEQITCKYPQTTPQVGHESHKLNKAMKVGDANDKEKTFLTTVLGWGYER